VKNPDPIQSNPWTDPIHVQLCDDNYCGMLATVYGKSHDNANLSPYSSASAVTDCLVSHNAADPSRTFSFEALIRCCYSRFPVEDADLHNAAATAAAIASPGVPIYRKGKLLSTTTD